MADLDQAHDLDIARQLAAAGVPIFLAKPALNSSPGNWDARGGHQHTGYLFPTGWQDTVADPAVLDRWQVGMAVCAVGGHRVDYLDQDDAKGGKESADGLKAAGLWPTVIGQQATPSGGRHDLVNVLGVASRDGVLPGLDVKAGRPDGTGRGFVFLAPTVKLSKVTGELRRYAWEVEPNLDELDPADPSVEPLAALIDRVRGEHEPVVDVPHAAWDAMSVSQKTSVTEYLERVVGYETKELLAVAAWPEGHRDDRDRGWQKRVADLCLRFGQLARADWTDWDPDAVRQRVLSIVPAAVDAAVGLDETWRAQWGRRLPAPFPTTLTEATTLPPVEGATVSTTATGDDDARADADALAGHRRVVLTAADTIRPRPVFWLWENRLALGTLGLLAGREGMAKSTLSYWLTGRITRGELPGRYQGEPRAVLVCATEDSWAHTIVPRLIAANADLSRVYRVDVMNADDIQVGLTLPYDLAGIEDSAVDVDAALLLLDPLMSRLGDLDTHRDAEVRRALEPMVALAERSGMSVLGLIHHNKSASDDPMQVVMGSRAFTAVARSVHTVVPDPDDDTDTRRLFGTPKNNLGRSDLPTLSFTVASHPVDTDEGTAFTGRIEWGEPITDSIAEMMRRSADSRDDRSAVVEAADWLKDFVTIHGGQVLSADAKKAGRAAGHSEAALKRARSKLRLQVTSSGYPKTTYWGDVPSRLTVGSPARGEI